MKKTEKHALTVRIALLVMLDILFMQVASFASLWIRHEFDFQAVEETFIHTVWRYMPLNILVTLAVFSMFHLYTSLWKYASITELSCIVAAVAISSLLHVLGMAVMGLKMFKSYLLLYFLLFLFMVVGLRFSYRFFRFVRNKCNRGMAEKRENVMIIGAGDAGAAIIKENRLSKAATRKVCCLIDKDPKKWGRYILGCPVVGGADKIMESVEKYKIQKIVIAIPSATSQQIKELVEICKETKCELKILPGIYQLIDGEVSISQLREVEIEDLLGREPVKVDLEEILGYIQGKTVLVTGGGGSIGSEICRQLAGHGVGKLIIFDVYENNAYAIQQELKRKYPNLDLEVLIGSVRNTSRMNDVFATYHPEIKFVIGRFFSTEQYAIFANASKELPVTLVATSLTAVLLPALVKLLDKEDKRDAVELWGNAANISFSFMALIVGGFLVFAPDIMSLFYSEKYVTTDGIAVFRIYTLILLFKSIYWGIFLNALGKTKFILYTSILTLILNFIGNIVFYYLMGFIGPAISSLLVIGIMAFAQLRFTGRLLNVPLKKILPWKNFGVNLIQTLVIGGAFFILKYRIFDCNNRNISIVISIVMGVGWTIIYGLINMKLLKRSWENLNS